MFLTDNGTKLVMRNVTSFLQKIDLVQRTMPVYHLESNPVEHVNRNLKTMIAGLLGEDQREWDKLIKLLPIRL